MVPFPRRLRVLRWTRVCAVLLAALGVACDGWDRAPESVRREPPRLLLLVTIDTLRADHLPFYGYPRDTAPFLSSLAERSCVFDRAVCAISYTLPSHTSMLTGVYPPRHGVLTNLQVFESDLPSLPSLLREAGYYTVAFTAVRFLKGLRRDFDEFHVLPSKTDPTEVYKPAGEVADAVLRWWREESPKHPRVFLWVHLFDAHEHGHVEGIDSRIAEEAPELRRGVREHLEHRLGRPVRDRDPLLRSIDAYDTQILRMDDALARLFEPLPAPGTFYAVVSDHGEGLGNHGFLGHARCIWQEQLRVPMFLGFSAEEPRRRRHGGVVRTIDLFPTFLEVAGLPPERTPRPTGIDALDAASLLPIVDGLQVRSDARLAFSMRRPADERMVRDKGWKAVDLFSIQDRRFKLIHASDGDDLLFDLLEDPREERDLLEDGGSAAAAERLRKRFLELIERVLEARGQEGSIDESRERELKELGYLK